MEMRVRQSACVRACVRACVCVEGDVEYIIVRVDLTLHFTHVAIKIMFLFSETIR